MFLQCVNCSTSFTARKALAWVAVAMVWTCWLMSHGFPYGSRRPDCSESSLHVVSRLARTIFELTPKIRVSRSVDAGPPAPGQVLPGQVPPGQVPSRQALPQLEPAPLVLRPLCDDISD